MKSIHKALAFALAAIQILLAPGLGAYAAAGQTLTDVTGAVKTNVPMASAESVGARVQIDTPLTGVELKTDAALNAGSLQLPFNPAAEQAAESDALKVSAAQRTMTRDSARAAVKITGQAPASLNDKKAGDKSDEKSAAEAASLFENSQPTTESVKVEYPADVFGKLTPAQKEDAAKFTEILNNRLFTWKDFPINLPKTLFDPKSGQIISPDDLFKAPTSDEVRRIGTSENGRGPKLNAEQLAQIEQTATFGVPSQEFPGQTHLWQLGGLLQKGKEAVRETLYQHNAKALAQLVVEIPNRLWKNTPVSVTRGIQNIGTGLEDISGLLIGRPELHQRYSDYEIEAAVNKERAKFIIAKLQKEHSNPDLRLFDDKLMEKAAPMVSSAVKASVQKWNQDLEKTAAAVEAELKKGGLSGEALEQAVADRLATMRNNLIESDLILDNQLDTLSPGLGALISRHLAAQLIVRQILLNFQHELSDFRSQKSAELQKTYPVRSRIASWFESTVDEAITGYVAANLGRVYQTMVDILTSKGGPTLESSMLSGDYLFTRDRAAAVRDPIAAEREAAGEFRFTRRIWRPSHWTIEKTTSPDGKTVYYSEGKYRTFTVDTGRWGWRLKNIGLRAFSWISDGAYALLIRNLLNGPLGLKSLVFSEPFHYDWQVNSQTGQLELSYATRRTLASRIRTSWKNRRDLLDDYKKNKDYGLLGPLFRRIGLFFTADLGFGVIVPLIVAIGQPILTVANAIVSIGLTATSAIWAPSLSLVRWLTDAFLNDASGTLYSRHRFRWGLGLVSSRLLPAEMTVIGRIGVEGVATVVAGIVGSVYHLLASAGFEAAGLARTGGRKIWDPLMLKLLAWRGRIPPRDYRFMVKRVAGPGLGSDYFFQVSPALVLVSLQAGLEADALAHFKAEKSALIRMPRQTLESVIAAWTPLTGGSSQYDDRGPAAKTLAQNEQALGKKLSAATQDRDSLYGRLLSIPFQSRIKLRNADYELTLKKAIVMTEKFYQDFFKSEAMTAEQIAAFWKSNSLKADDWQGLAKIRLAALFGQEFLLPLEETDKTLRIHVEAPTLGDIAHSIESGIPADEVKNVQLNGVSPDGKTPVRPNVPEATSDMATDRYFPTSK